MHTVTVGTAMKHVDYTYSNELNININANVDIDIEMSNNYNTVDLPTVEIKYLRFKWKIIILFKYR